MAITKNTYATSHSISYSYWRVINDPLHTDIIIIEEVIGLNSPPQNGSDHEDEIVWISVESDGAFNILGSAPSTGTAFSPVHIDWENSQIIFTAGEVFVLEHTGTPFTDNNRSAVTGYEIPDSEILYIKIDHANKEITVYPE